VRAETLDNPFRSYGQTVSETARRTSYARRARETTK